MQPQEKPTKSIRDAMRDAALVGTKTGRSDYVHISTLAEVLRWQQGFEALFEACEAIAAAVDGTKYCKHCNADDNLGYGFCGWHADPLTNALELVRSAITKAKGE